eukprot:7786978-Alexandrium_andersonii.AAC.1
MVEVPQRVVVRLKLVLREESGSHHLRWLLHPNLEHEDVALRVDGRARPVALHPQPSGVRWMP